MFLISNRNLTKKNHKSNEKNWDSVKDSVNEVKSDVKEVKESTAMKLEAITAIAKELRPTEIKQTGWGSFE